MPISTKISIEEFNRRMNELYPKCKYEILCFDSTKQNIRLKCLKCGKVHQFKKIFNVFARINFCSCEKEFLNIKEKVEYLLKLNNFILLEWKGSGKKVKVQCKKCKNIQFRFPSEILKSPWYCKNCNNSETQIMTKEDIQKKIDRKFGKNNYEILNYSGWREKAVIKCESCKLIFKQNIGHFLDGCGCPKCIRKRSKGEKEISKWLSDKKIYFKSQYFLSYKDGTRGYADFYLPDYNLIIEYNGEQHYKPNIFFKGEENFLHQKERDLKKEKYCIENSIKLLIIPYWEFKNIDIILSSQFNDYLKRVAI